MLTVSVSVSVLVSVSVAVAALLLSLSLVLALWLSQGIRKGLLVSNRSMRGLASTDVARCNQF